MTAPSKVRSVANLLLSACLRVCVCVCVAGWLAGWLAVAVCCLLSLSIAKDPCDVKPHIVCTQPLSYWMYSVQGMVLSTTMMFLYPKELVFRYSLHRRVKYL